jgi:hypothetical protein
MMVAETTPGTRSRSRLADSSSADSCPFFHVLKEALIEWVEPRKKGRLKLAGAPNKWAKLQQVLRHSRTIRELPVTLPALFVPQRIRFQNKNLCDCE